MPNQGTCGDCEYEKRCLRRGDLPLSNKVECPARTRLREVKAELRECRLRSAKNIEALEEFCSEE